MEGATATSCLLDIFRQKSQAENQSQGLKKLSKVPERKGNPPAVGSPVAQSRPSDEVMKSTIGLGQLANPWLPDVAKVPGGTVQTGEP
jgi:hypothetical protein